MWACGLRLWRGGIRIPWRGGVCINGCVSARWQVLAKDQKVMMFGFLGGYLLFVALVICAVAGNSAVRLHSIRTTWPTADAEVLGCREVMTGIARGRKSWSTQCQLRYSVGGTTYAANTWTRFPDFFRGEVPRWIAEHPPGSHLLIYYPPGAPRGPVNLGGADAAIDSEEPTHFFKVAGVFALGGVALLMSAYVRLRANAANFQ